MIGNSATLAIALAKVAKGSKCNKVHDEEVSLLQFLQFVDRHSSFRLKK